MVESVALVTLDELNAVSHEAFVELLGAVFEGSPWVAEGAWADRPFASVARLHARMCDVVARAPNERREALIASHPELAGREAEAGELSAASRDEQASASLDRLDPATLSRLRDLNDRYGNKFGFPCVLCVREHGTVENILAAMERRLDNTREQEIETCIREIGKIARLRLEELVAANPPGRSAIGTGYLTTHVLDTARGVPGAGMHIEFSRRVEGEWHPIGSVTTNADGRTDFPLLASGEMELGEYELLFDVGAYFSAYGVAVSDPPYLTQVPVRVTLADPDAHYHVPLIVAPWSYTTYRGS